MLGRARALSIADALKLRGGDGPMTILILGGYGVFGGRLARLLADIPQATLLISGRDITKAQQFCAEYVGQASVRPLELDRRDIADALAKETPHLVVDASGPFQAYGAKCYGVIEACIEAGVDYLDFADAADFVFGVSRYDRRANEAGVFILSGVSSFPVLTAAVLREMGKTMDIVSVEGGIAPSPYAGIGLNVIRAVVGYAGSPVKLLRAGVQARGTGLAESTRYTIATPGRLPLRNIRFSLVDVPDLQVIPPEHPTMKDIWMGAGPVPESLHRFLNLLAHARAKFGLPSLTPFSRLFYSVLNLMKFGEHRGGMFVQARGIRKGEPVKASWHLIAEGDDGPFIPSMAIEGIVRKLLAGDRPTLGARPATSALELADYDRLFEGKSIYTGIRHEDPNESLYRRLLGPAFDTLPPQVRALHEIEALRTWRGVAQVRRGRGLLARLIAALIGLPNEGEQIPVAVTFSPQKGGERWTRTFGNKEFSSHQSYGRGRNQYLLVEQFGIVAVSLALVVEDKRMFLIPRRWSVLGIPMPKSLLPNGTSFEAEEHGRFQFNVTISIPLVGLVAAYRGSLSPNE
jgi:hypothetical protein